MKTKLLLFTLLLLCFSTQQFYPVSCFKFSGFRRGFNRGENAVSDFCDFMKLISGGLYNCTTLPASVVTNAVNTDDTMPDVSVDKFIINISVGGGNTPQNVSLIVDTTLDYTFMLCQCRSLDSCSTNLNLFDPTLSNTFSNYTWRDSEYPSLQDHISCSGGYCMYNYTEDAVSSKGPLGQDTFNFNTTSPYPFAFGCGDVNTGNYGYSIGFLGLGSGRLSLLSQTDFGKFSYCFGSSGNGAFFWGSDAQLKTNLGESIELLHNKLVPMFHYVNFTGVSLGGEYLDIPSSSYLPQPDGTGGMVSSSTSPLTYLEQVAYNALRDAFVKKMSCFSQVNGSEYNLDLCFAIPAGQQVTIPQLTLHFNGGANMNPYNFSYFQINSDQTVGCLLLLPLQGISVLGYKMQYDAQIIYDVNNSMLHFEKIDCDTL